VGSAQATRAAREYARQGKQEVEVHGVNPELEHIKVTVAEVEVTEETCWDYGIPECYAPNVARMLKGLIPDLFE
jgi:hypothetical protein